MYEAEGADKDGQVAENGDGDNQLLKNMPKMTGE